MTLQFMHPSRSKLHAWLSALAPSDKVTTHVESCERCASRLIDIADTETTGAEKAADESLLAQVVKTEWVPAIDFTQRVIQRIDQQEKNERDLSVMLGLFGLAGRTAELMLPDDGNPPHPDAEMNRWPEPRRPEPRRPESRWPESRWPESRWPESRWKDRQMNEWISAAIAIGGGLVIGSIVSRIVRSRLAKSSIPALRESASALGGLVFSGFIIVGLLVALGFVSPDDLDQLPSDLISFLPKAISAAIVAIGGNIAGTFAQSAVAKAVSRSGAAARFAPMIVKMAILAASLILAAAQLGVDTTVINIAVAALLFCIATSVALLTGLGGRHIAGQVAAGRVWRHSLEAGDRIRAKGVAGVNIDGVVIDIHPTAVEIAGAESTMFVPNAQLMDAVVERIRPTTTDAPELGK